MKFIFIISCFFCMAYSNAQMVTDTLGTVLLNADARFDKIKLKQADITVVKKAAPNKDVRGNYLPV